MDESGHFVGRVDFAVDGLGNRIRRAIPASSSANANWGKRREAFGPV
jgi:hypothetical protein